MAAGDLTTLADVKAYLSIAGSADDALLADLITKCSFAVGNYLNRNLLSQSYVERYDGQDGPLLMLRNTPVTAVTSLALNGVALAPTDGVTVGYGLAPNYVYGVGLRFSRGIQNVAISYTAGYSAVPLDVAEAVVEFVSDRYRLRGRLGENTKSMPQGGSTSYDMSYMSKKVQGSLSNYRRMIPI